MFLTIYRSESCPAWQPASFVGASRRWPKTPQRLGRSEQRGLDDGLAVAPTAQDSTPYLCAVKWLFRESETARYALRIPPPEHGDLGGSGRAVDMPTRHAVGEVSFSRPQRDGGGAPILHDAKFDTIQVWQPRTGFAPISRTEGSRAVWMHLHVFFAHRL